MLYYDGVEEDINFSKEKITTVRRRGAGGGEGERGKVYEWHSVDPLQLTLNKATIPLLYRLWFFVPNAFYLYAKVFCRPI